MKCDRLSGFSDMGLSRQEHPFSQQAEKAAGHTGSRRIYVAASSADIRLSGPSARQVLARRVQGSVHCFNSLLSILSFTGHGFNLLKYSNKGCHIVLNFYVFIYFVFTSIYWRFSTHIYICYIHIHCLLQLYTIQETY